MHEDAQIGSPVTLAELKSLGEFVRWQEIGARVAEHVEAKRLPDGYPLVPSRLPSSGLIDLSINRRWQRVKFLRLEDSLAGDGRRVVYDDDSAEKSEPFDWYGVAPAGHFTAWAGKQPESLAGAKLLEDFPLAQQGHRIHEQSLIAVDWPYLTFEAVSYHPDARWVEREDMWNGTYTVHAADPRVEIEGIVPRQPWFNTTIAVSHRWLSPDHPDPERVQYGELLTLCETLGLHDNQAFLIDYCSLPQHPRSDKEAEWFREQLPGFQAQFKHVTLVLNAGSEDYATRAWCMFELMLTSLSRATRPVLLNHDKLDASLAAAANLARQHVQESVWSQQNLAKLVAGGLNTSTFNKWARNPMNVALYNAAIQGRSNILEKFEKHYAVKDESDRLLIIGLLKSLAFGEAGNS